MLTMSCLVFSLVSQNQEVSQPKPLYLGVLEDHAGNYSGQPNFRCVRAVFQKVGDAWKPLPWEVKNYKDLQSAPAKFPVEVTWTIAFDGKDIGQVTARTPTKFEFYSLIGMESITSNGPVPTIASRSESFSGFEGGAVYRPLIAVSQPNFTDPDRWKRSKLPAETVAALRKRFHERFPHAENCSSPEDNNARAWLYDDKNIEIDDSYTSKSGSTIASLSLNDYRCDGPPGDGGPFGANWFVVDERGNIRFLDSGLWLVGAGDYDNDGESELVFAIGRYDLGGYEIFSDSFARHATFQFSFH
jgi:hypothetical protein